MRSDFYYLAITSVLSSKGRDPLDFYVRSHDNDTKFGMVTRVASGPPTEFMNIHVLIPFDLCDEYDSSQKSITYYHPTLTPNCYNIPIAPTHKPNS